MCFGNSKIPVANLSNLSRALSEMCYIGHGITAINLLLGKYD